MPANPIQPMRQPPAFTKAQKVGGGMSAAVLLILGAVYANEGGYVNDKRDPGGETNHGITIAVARQSGFKGRMIDLKRRCTADADVCADKIYTEKYIMKPGYGPFIELSPAVAEELVDTAVNMGPPRPSRWLQEALSVPVDGKVGKVTITAYVRLQQRMGRHQACVYTLDTLDAKQKAEYLRLIRVNPSLARFKRGWLNNRVGNVDRARCAI